MTKKKIILLNLIVLISIGFSFCNKNVPSLVIINDSTSKICIPDLSDVNLRIKERWKKDTVEITILFEAKYYLGSTKLTDIAIDGNYNVNYLCISPGNKVKLRMNYVTEQDSQRDFDKVKVIVIKDSSRDFILIRNDNKKYILK